CSGGPVSLAKRLPSLAKNEGLLQVARHSPFLPAGSRSKRRMAVPSTCRTQEPSSVCAAAGNGSSRKSARRRNLIIGSCLHLPCGAVHSHPTRRQLDATGWNPSPLSRLIRIINREVDSGLTHRAGLPAGTRPFGADAWFEDRRRSAA